MSADLCRELERRWHREIPISAAMGIAVQTFSADELVIAAPLERNVNVHGSIFAGSQFSLAALCGWGQLYCQLSRRRLDGSILFVNGHIDCLKPVRADMLARCRWHEAAASALDELEGSGRARTELSAEVESGGAIAATFTGTYGIRL